MFKSVRSRKNSKEQAEIKITPLIDMVFILLIFFIVTTSFVSETGLTVERPQARSSESLERESVLIGIGPSGEIYMSGQRVSIFSLRPLIEHQLKNNPKLSTVLVADKSVSAELIVRVMDELRLGGVERIALAAGKKR